MKYRTEQKEALLAFLKEERDRQFTLGELAEEVGKIATIGASTVYRLMHALTEEGLVRRFTVGGSRIFYYQYTEGDCHTHLHLKCTKCGKLFHLDGAVSHFMEKQIYASHKFRLNEHETMLFGICGVCEGGTR